MVAFEGFPVMVHVSSSAGALPQHVHKLDDPVTGLSGLIVIHSTRLGPAAGGCRFRPYADPAALAIDALRLAEGMSYKNALAGLPLGGGKAVIDVPRGAYITAEDVGTTTNDMLAVRNTTSHVAGLPASGTAPGGDPSPWTAMGVFLSIEEMLERRLGRPPERATVAVQGLGAVGFALCRQLVDAGARLIVSEPRGEVVERARIAFGSRMTVTDDIIGARANVFAPCALGGVLDKNAIARLRATIMCGAANNQLATPEDGERLAAKGVLYAPDYVVNAGGIINVAAEYLARDASAVSERVWAIPDRLRQVLDFAQRSGMSPGRAADQLARDRIAAGFASIDAPVGAVTAKVAARG
jgi:leucine dehydrogenase